MTTYSRTIASTVIATIAAWGGLALPVPATAAQQSTNALSECPSGYFCVWSDTNYSGNMQRISATNSYRSISLVSTRSYYNHRSQRTWLHEESDGSGSYVCLNPGASKASTSGWQASADAAYLATVTNC